MAQVWSAASSAPSAPATPEQAPIDALLFDVGGVLIEVDFRLAFAHWAQCASVPIEKISSRFRADAAYEAHERGEIGGAEYFAALRTSLGIDITDEQFTVGWCSIFRGLIPGVAELLARLAAVRPVYLFSNTNAVHYARWQTQFPEIVTPITQTFCSQQIGLRKPDIKAYEKVCALIGLPPQRIAFFDDLAENIDGARRAGLVAHHVPSFADTERAIAQLCLPPPLPPTT